MYAKITEKSCEAFKLLFLRTTDFTVTLNLALTKKEVFSQLRSNGSIPLLSRTKKARHFRNDAGRNIVTHILGLIIFFQNKKKPEFYCPLVRMRKKKQMVFLQLYASSSKILAYILLVVGICLNHGIKVADGDSEILKFHLCFTKLQC